jgi:hypothetical protein
MGQSPAFGRKSEVLNTKSSAGRLTAETSRMEYSVKNLSPDIISKICGKKIPHDLHKKKWSFKVRTHSP